MVHSIDEKANGFVLPGWEPERRGRIKELFERYKRTDKNRLFDHLVYFLNAMMPVCHKYNINMAIHPDDPAYQPLVCPVFANQSNLLKLLSAVPNRHNMIVL